FAGISITASPPIERFLGVSAFLCLYNPHVNGTGQYSAATIYFSNGAGKNLEQIQVGWIVHPKLNGDTRTHLYTTWTADGFHTTGCYNTHCPGFIQLSRVIPVDYAFPRTSDLETRFKEEVLLRVYQ
uniref:Neprosin PEP catalytic domain-containing protein n=1 Tax=Nicotiana tabacum TaxID=4097 RepID=A0A1S3XCI0_TOBAC